MYRSIDLILDKHLAEWVEMRQDFHRHPELAYEEKRTAGKVVEYLSEIPGMEITTGLAETGVLGVLGKEKAGPCVALRADMDALPIVEESGVSYASREVGKMHACGHDGHTTMLLGAAKVLGEIQDELSGPVKFIFQPAEEGGAGAKRMMDAGVLMNPRVDAIFGLHNMPLKETQVGQIAHCPGSAMAGTGTFEIVIEGVGGHAAFPHRCVDPIYVGAQVVNAFQGIVSRGLDPIESGVVSVTQFHAGSTHNVIPKTAILKGTFRALNNGVLEQLADDIKARAESIAMALGGRALVEVKVNYPVLVNHCRTDAVLRKVVESIGRSEDWVEVKPMMGGEDFAFYQLDVPGTFWFLPARKADDLEPLMCHHPQYDFNDAILTDGIRLHVEIARRFGEYF